MRQTRSGFTLLEMMVVVSISLAMMILMVPIFQTTTSAVKQVERKLALYEAGRNILDIVEAEVRLAVTNERGGRFSIKSVAWDDNDPYANGRGTPPGAMAPDPTWNISTSQPADGDAAREGYRQSRREADSLDYVRLEPAGFQLSYATATLPFPGAKYFPLAYPTRSNDWPEGWRASLRTSLTYQTAREWYSSDYEFSSATQERWTRGEQLADVGTIEASFVFLALTHEWRYWNNGSAYVTHHFTETHDMLQPGLETRVVPGYSGDQGSQWMRRIQGIRLIDLDFAYWDEKLPGPGGSTVGRFLNPPDNGVIYFWPAPKAIRVTISVMDRDKRGILTLCRVVHVPVGMGDGHCEDGYKIDTAYDEPNDQFNRIKNMAKCTRMYGMNYVYNGMPTTPWSSDRQLTEAKMLTTYKVPLNWNANP